MAQTEIRFKNEGTDEQGRAIGPVTFLDFDQYDADPVIVAHRAEGRSGRPYGYVPQGMRDLGWMTEDDAAAIAASEGAELVSS